MWKGLGSLISSAALVLVIVGFFLARYPEPSSGQQDQSGTRQPACGCYICGDPRFRNFEDPPKNCAGILSVDACPAELAKLPEPTRKAFCQKVKEARNFTSFKDSCPEYAASCEPKKNDKPKPKCEEQKTPPWFDTGAKCDDPMMLPPVPSVRAEPHRGGVSCSISYTVCGFLMSEPRAEYFSTGLPSFFSRMSQEEADKFCSTKGFGSDTVPVRLTCCKKWNQGFTDWIAFRRQHGPDAPGHPCTPSIDADCDGTPNFQDPTPIGDCAEYPGRPSPSP